MGTFFDVLIGETKYRGIQGHPTKGMIGKKFDMFDVMKINKRHAELWMPNCPEMDALFVKSREDGDKVVDIVHLIPLRLHPKTWRVFGSRHDFDYVLEIRPDNEARVGDSVKIQEVV